jgi:hypothetical protein
MNFPSLENNVAMVATAGWGFGIGPGFFFPGWKRREIDKITWVIDINIINCSNGGILYSQYG